MTTSKTPKIIKYIISVYCLLYFISFIVPFFYLDPDAPALEMSKVEIATVSIAFILFFFGTIAIWFNEKIGGIILLGWHLMCWIFSMLIWPEAGMILVLILPILFLATITIQYWYVKNVAFYKAQAHQWQLSLRILLINYLLIYLLVVFANVVPRLVGWDLPTRVDELAITDYTSFLGILMIFELFLFLGGFILSWINELMAATIFILWYLVIIFMTILYAEFANSGPWIFFGVVILVQAIFYISNHFKFKPRT